MAETPAPTWTPPSAADPGFPRPYTAPPYAAPPYAAPPYAAPPYEAPPYAAPPQRSLTPRRATAIVLAVAVLVVLATLLLGTTMRTGSSRFIPVPASGFAGTFATGRPLIGRGATFHLEGSSVAADDLASGERRWTTDIRCPYADWADSQRTAAEDSLVVRCGTDLVSVAAATGAERWRTTLPSSDTSFIRVSSSAVALGYDHEVVTLDPSSGAVRWRHPIPPSTYATSPIETDATAVYVSEPRVVDGRERDALVALDPATGSDRWVAPVSTAAVMASEGALFVRSDGHSVVRLDPASGGVQWSSKPNDPDLSWASVIGTTPHSVITRDRNGAFAAYDVDTGAKRWVHAQGRTQAVAPTISTAAGPTTTQDDQGQNLSDTYAAVGDERVVVTGSSGVVVLDAMTGQVVLRDPGSDTGRASAGGGKYAVIDRQSGVVVRSSR